MKELFKLNKKHLLLIAGIVWGFAGYNILRIGFMAYIGNEAWWRYALSILIFLVFWAFVFSKMVKKHTARIIGYEADKQYFFKFFDIKGFCIMAFMITLGVTLRVSHICPDVYIAVFYTGLGASLSAAGVLFLVNYFMYLRKNKQN